MTHQSEKKQPQHSEQDAQTASTAAEQHTDNTLSNDQSSKESGGPSGPEPTRYGDWERKGRCIDF